jgi:hypothetical protein
VDYIALIIIFTIEIWVYYSCFATTAFGTKLAHEFERRTAGFAVLKPFIIGQKIQLIKVSNLLGALQIHPLFYKLYQYLLK